MLQQFTNHGIGSRPIRRGALLTRTLTACVALASLGACTVQPRASGDDAPTTTRSEMDADAVSAEVTAVVERYTRATERRDSATIRELTVDDDRFVWYEEGEPRYRSDAEMLASLAMFPPDLAITTTLGPIDVARVGEGGAHASAAFETVVGEGEFAFDGRIDMVLERSPDGWRIVRGTSH